MDKDLMQATQSRGSSVIKGLTFWLAAIFSAAILVGCNVDVSDDYDPPLYETEIVSNLDADGDIAFSLPNNYTVASARTTGTVLAGVDPVDGDEFRGFLAFPIRGANGVPFDALIESATLEIYISGVTEESRGTGVPLIFDLVSFSPPVLIASDFDRTPLVSLYDYTVFTDDVGYILSFDVTSLLVEAQQLGLTNFQIRMALDTVFADSGLIEIEDSIPATAPLLTVTYD